MSDKLEIAIAGATGSSYQVPVDAIAAAEEVADYRVEIVYTDGEGFRNTDSPVRSSAAEVEKIDNGDAGYQLQTNGAPISGAVSIGSVITAAEISNDVDGNLLSGSSVGYEWQTAAFGTQEWNTVGTESRYTATTADSGKDLQLLISYRDGQDYQEELAALTVEAAPPAGQKEQILDLSNPSQSTLRAGFTTSTSISYDVGDGQKELTGISPSLYFDSSQVSVDFINDPYSGSLLGKLITEDSADADNNPQTDSVVALTYTDFGGRFPGSSASLPLKLADLSITPTAEYIGTALTLSGTGAIGYQVIGDSLALGYDAAPIVNNDISSLTIDALNPWTYQLPSDWFVDPDSDLTISVDTGLPDWLSFDTATSTFTGTPASSDDSLTISISAADALGSTSSSFDLNVRDVQKISATQDPINYQGGQAFSFPLIFSSTDDESSTGLAFQLHYDSSLFSFSTIDNPINEILGFSTTADTANVDNDSKTDSVLNVTVTAFDGSLASGTKLGDFKFDVADIAPANPNDPDPVTGLRPSEMNFTSSTTAIGYGFAADPINLKPVLFNLDVDGDGQVTPLGDGLMVIRKLFGATFAGDALTNKAISPIATRTTAEISDYIQSGIDGGLLDVDRDGLTTPLGDGLMVIRSLFGATFTGSALTNKAISPDSLYANDERPWEAVATNIDSLMLG